MNKKPSTNPAEECGQAPPVHLDLNVRGLPPSATVAINEQCDRLLRDGRRIFKMGLGQSPFPVPQPASARPSRQRCCGEVLEAADRICDRVDAMVTGDRRMLKLASYDGIRITEIRRFLDSHPLLLRQRCFF